jgi:GAF domain-containing protein
VSAGLFKELNVRCLLVAPLRSPTAIIGAMFITRSRDNPFTERDKQLAMVFADQVTTSIASAAALDSERRQRQRSDALLGVLQASSSSPKLVNVLHRLARSVLKLSVAQRCSMMVFGEGSKTSRQYSVGTADDLGALVINRRRADDPHLTDDSCGDLWRRRAQLEMS